MSAGIDFIGEKIVAVAIRQRNLIVTLPPPARHGDVLTPLHKLTGILVEPRDQGFLTDAGRFVEREEAAVLAVRCGQIEEPQWGRELYSEDLW